MVPAPLIVERREGAPFLIRPGIQVVVGRDPSAVAAAVLIAGDLGRELGLPIPVGHGEGSAAIQLRLTTELGELDSVPPALATEAYRLEVTADQVRITALDPIGLVRGAATLAQLVSRTAAGLGFPAVRVVDWPRFQWRGLSLDVARHFFDTGTIKTVITVLAALKLNVLHLHLTDDQGWRLQLPSRPELTERSGRTGVGGDPAAFLAISEYRDLITYAAARGVTVVPEIDMPGHVNAALHAYPELNPSGVAAPVYEGIGMGFSRLDPDLPATAKFITDVFGDLAELTPGPYVHLGGDEALTMHPAEYSEVVHLAASTLAAAGKTVVGWQEVARANLPPGSILQYWDDRKRNTELLAAARRGARLLLSPASRLYLDMRYDADTPVGVDWAGHIGLRDCYEWEPAELLPVPTEQLVGVEAALWTETVRTSRELFLLLLPRLAAVAEVAWSAPGRRRWDGLRRRLRRLATRWDSAGLPWYRPAL